MKEQINKYARGIYEYEPLVAKTIPTSINDVVQKNQKYVGSIRVSEEKGRELKGIIYSTCNRVVICNPQFVGTDCDIEYTVDTYGIEAGERIQGYFNIITSGGEEMLPFEFMVEAGAYDTELGDVKNLFHFANLAQTDLFEAHKLFISDEFSDVFLKDDLSMSKLREQLLLGSDSKTALEEFLVSIHKKTRVNIKLDNTECTLSNIDFESQETVTLSKDVWGRTNINVSTDANFIRLSKTLLIEEDFAGGVLDYIFHIEPDKLYAGKNVGRITFATPYEDKVFTVTVDNSVDESRRIRSLSEKKNMHSILESYLRFRVHEINITEWILQTKTAITELLSIDEENPFYNLFMSQVLTADKKINEAKFYLDNAKDAAVAARDTDRVLYCYYLYVSTIIQRDRNYAKETAATVKEIYEKEDNNWKILWILLYLDVEMAKNKSLKLLRIKEQFNRGMRSPMLYLEACIILNEQPMLLRVLNDFEINALLFGCKQKVINERLCEQAAELALKADCKPGLLYRLLTNLYELTNNKEVLEVICGTLIRYGMIGPKYLKWYAQGIEKDVKVTKLYESYLASRSNDDDSVLPKMVLLYFGYNNELSHKLKAYLYANIIRYKEMYPQIYKNYTIQMIEFVQYALKTGYADENAGVVFDEYLNADMINEENASSAAEALFTYKVVCKNQKMRNVIVGHKETKEVVKYPLVDGVGYIKVYTMDPCICFEDSYGRWYKESIEYDYEPVYKDDYVIKKLINYCDNNLLLALHFCEKHLRYQNNDLESIRLYHRTAHDEKVRPEYKRYLMGQVVDYYFDSYEGEDTETLLATIEIDSMSEGYVAKLVEAFIIHGEYDEAYKYTKRVRNERLNAKRVLKLCDQILVQADASEELFVPEESFVNLAYYAFSRAKYNDLLLRFLNVQFNGSTAQMIELWEACMENHVDSYALEERILGQMLFSGHYSKKTSQVFEHYYKDGASERIVEAYLGYNSYNYFVKDYVIADSIFEIIEARIEAEKDVALVCKLALMKNYAERDKLDNVSIDIARILMDKLVRKGYIFAFYEKFKEYFQLPHGIADKTIIEYHTNPSNRVMIHYMVEDSDELDFSARDMKNVFEGIFVKTFVLFYGDNLEYYITEENENGQVATESMRIENRSVGGKHPEGRFELINEMLVCKELHDNKSLDKQLHIYGVNNAIVNQLFKPLD